MVLFKHRPGIHIVGTPAAFTAVDRQPTAFGTAKYPRFRYGRLTPRTMYPFGVKVTLDPLQALFHIQKIRDGELHLRLRFPLLVENECVGKILPYSAHFL